jgi:hypothetical protein
MAICTEFFERLFEKKNINGYIHRFFELLLEKDSKMPHLLNFSTISKFYCPKIPIFAPF